MSITGIICEYNPLHLGHSKQLRQIRQAEPDGGIVCLMSGNYVQRGMPAVFDKAFRAAAAIDCGADLVLELPVTAALSSAEGFASEGVRQLGGFCHELSFGAEDPDVHSLTKTAEILLSPAFSQQLKAELAEGRSFPAARQKAAEKMGLDAALLAKPNNILAIEYCKAILSQNSKMKPAPIFRPGDYNDTLPHPTDPSATSVRQCIENGENWLSYIPDGACKHFADAPAHSLSWGERAVLTRLRTMTDVEFEALPYGSEGLWRKLMKNARQLATLEQILSATKSKRYTRTRLDRMVMCAFLGITQDSISTPAPYARVLALNDKGRQILTEARKTGDFPNIGETLGHPYERLEARCDDLYGLFCKDYTEMPGQSKNRRIYYAGRKDTVV
ncbi:MAG: nucleotidyltransferase family protein [Oscillospiraceae bacterium]|nr:nucleotidyltransferase family protein [Oscillospiraceae bacterium]